MKEHNIYQGTAEKKHSVILPVLNLKCGFSVFKRGKHYTGFLQFNASSLGIFLTETSSPPLPSLASDTIKNELLVALSNLPWYT